MATETLRPDGAGDAVDSLIYALPDTAVAVYGAFTSQYPDSDYHWDKVDEASSDEDGTYVANAGDWVNRADLYALPNSGIGAGAINSVTIYNRARIEAAGTVYMRPCLKTHSLVYGLWYSGPTTSYADDGDEYATNPNTGAAWTWAEIDALQIGVCGVSTGADCILRCTQVWVVVDYTPPIIVTPTTLALILTEFAPTIAIDFAVTPTTLALVLTTYAPTVSTPRLVTPTTLALTLTTYAPVIAIDFEVVPTTLALTLTTFAPIVLTPVLCIPTTLALILTTFAPTILTPVLVTPSTLALTLTTYIPSIIRIYFLFYGYIETITPHPHPDEQDAYISALDGLDFLARHELDTVLTKDALTGALVTVVLDDAGWSATLRSIDAGQDTVPYGYWHKVRARFALADIEDSELGFVYVNGSGQLVFEDRHHRYSATHQTSQATFDDTMAYITYDYSARNIYNIVRATVTPWEVQSITDLWTLEETPSIPAGETSTYWGEASVSGESVFVNAWTTPVATTDYTANSAAGGGGDDETANVSIVTTKLAKTIKLAVTNNATHAVYMTLLKARGTYYDSLTKVSRKSEDSTSQTAYQERTLELDGKYLTDADKAQDFCDYAVARFKDPQAEITMTLLNKNSTNLTQILTREISDRITIQNTKLGLNQDFFINKIEHEITEGGKLHKCTWRLSSALNEDFWCWDFSKWGVSTKWGY